MDDQMAELQAYLQRHVAWRVAGVVFAAIMVAVFWTMSRGIAYVFLALGALELSLLPYYWRRARRVRRSLAS
jgi:hypothetical protein